MILSQVSYLDCFVFLIFLAPQLLLQVGLFVTVACGLRALPFILIQLPISFFYERFFTPKQSQSPFVRQATGFEDFVVRCVRYAFAKIPANVGRVFFSKPVALPFLRWRMLRHGFIFPPVNWHEVSEGSLNGLWIISDEMEEPDIVIYYAHGGGFSMGSNYFYLEFLLAWHTLLSQAGYRNPAIFAIEYTLVPDSCFPTQLQQVLAGYHHALSQCNADSSKICVSGDSAGATLILSLLLHLGRQEKGKENGEIVTAGAANHTMSKRDLLLPALAVLISPWVTLISEKDHNTSSDYLDLASLHLYARQYAGPKASPLDPLLSPGNCTDLSWWRAASPTKGFGILFGAEEVFGPEIRDLIARFGKAGVKVMVDEEEGGIHAWPVACLFLSSTRKERQKGLRRIVGMIRENMS